MTCIIVANYSSAVFSGGAGGARAPPEFRGSQKGRSLISAYQSLAITKNTPELEKLNTALIWICKSCHLDKLITLLLSSMHFLIFPADF